MRAVAKNRVADISQDEETESETTLSDIRGGGSCHEKGAADIFQTENKMDV